MILKRKSPKNIFWRFASYRSQSADFRSHGAISHTRFDRRKYRQHNLPRLTGAIHPRQPRELAVTPSFMEAPVSISIVALDDESN
jgi:hypothetical protein